MDPSVFEPPADYATLGPGRSEPMRDEDDNLLQFAIQQSLLDAGTESDQVRSPGAKLACLPAVQLLSLFLLRRCLVNQPGKTWTSGIFQVTIWEALTNSRPMPQSPMYEEDSQLER